MNFLAEVKGKLAYAAPEQVLEGGEVTRRTDVFAAGIVLWELLTARRLFRGTSDIETYRKVIACEVPSPPEVLADDRALGAARPVAEVEALAPIAARALSRDPQGRYATAAEMAAAIESAIPWAVAAERGAWVQRLAARELDEQKAIIMRVEAAVARDSRGADLDDSATVVGFRRRAEDHDRPQLGIRALVGVALAALLGAALGGALLTALAG